MGCDIHFVIERRKKSGGKWIGVYNVDALPIDCRPAPRNRDYDFFAEIAHVRGNGSDKAQYPRNVPEDISDLAWQSYMEAPRDYHSASHMDVGEFCEIYLRVNPKAGRKEFAAYDLLGYLDGDRYNHRVVFWFDN